MLLLCAPGTGYSLQSSPAEVKVHIAMAWAQRWHASQSVVDRLLACSPAGCVDEQLPLQEYDLSGA